MNKMILEICENIKEYEEKEFGYEINDIEKIFDENMQCHLAYTTKGDDEEFEIQVTLDLKNMRISRELSHVLDIYTEYDCFNNLKEIAEFTEYMDFEGLIETDVDVEELLKTFIQRELKTTN